VEDDEEFENRDPKDYKFCNGCADEIDFEIANIRKMSFEPVPDSSRLLTTNEVFNKRYQISKQNRLSTDYKWINQL
jgi:hypothetical protein